MGKENSGVFRFKQFECRHSRSSMKISADAVLLGAWSSATEGNILDVGTGCGVIALMCAQKNPCASIYALDIDADSLSDAFENFSHSPWGDRIFSILEDFNAPVLSDLPQFHRILPSFDLIISNPPYFDSGVNVTDSPRLRARHDCALPLSVLLRNAKSLLTPRGKIELILPYGRLKQLLKIIKEIGLEVDRLVNIKGHPGASVKRILVGLTSIGNITEESSAEDKPLVLQFSPGVPSEEYRELCSPFYLSF